MLGHSASRQAEESQKYLQRRRQHTCIDPVEHEAGLPESKQQKWKNPGQKAAAVLLPQSVPEVLLKIVYGGYLFPKCLPVRLAPAPNPMSTRMTGTFLQDARSVTSSSRALKGEQEAVSMCPLENSFCSRTSSTANSRPESVNFLIHAL